MRTKTLAVVCIAAATTLAATGCGSSSGSNSRTIKVVYHKQLNNDNNIQPAFVASMAKAFEKANPGTTVKLVPITSSDNDYYTKAQLMMRSSATAPDLIYEDTALINSDITSGYLKPLDSYLASWSDWSQYADAAKAAVKGASDSKTYGIPDNTDTRGIWYNKAIFARAGIATPWQPKTWADVLSAAQKVKATVSGVTPMNIYTGTPGGEASSMQGFEMLLYGTPAADKSLYDTSQKKWIVGSKGFKDALNFVHTVFGEKLGPAVQTALDANFGNSVGSDLIPSGKLAIDIDGSWMPQHWISTGDKPWAQWQTTMGVAAMPTQNGQGTGKVSMSGGWAWSIPGKAKNPDLAWKFLKSLETKAASAQWNTIDATIATRDDVAADPKYLKAMPTNAFFNALVKYTYYRPGVPAYAQVSSAIQKAMESVTTGQSSVSQAASTFDNDVKSAVGAENTTQGSQ